jgi:hypothetical protein
MLRVVFGVASLLILGGLVMQHAVTLPRAQELPLSLHVDQGIPLATIDLRSTSESLTTDHVARGALWWQHQSQALLDQLTELLRNETRANGWTDLYASGTADGGHVLVAVGNLGRLGTIRFAGDGTLLACDTTPNAVLPIVLPSAEGGFRPITTDAAHDLLLRLRYLRERSPVAWYQPETIVPENEAKTSGGQRIAQDPLLSESEGMFSSRRSACFARKRVCVVVSDDVEPPLPVANN